MHQQYCVSFLCIIPWAAVVLSVNCWSRMWRVRCCAISSCLTEVCVESRRLDLLRRWQHVMFHYTALALTVWKPGAKQTGISRSLFLSLAVSLSHTHICTPTITHVYSVHTSKYNKYARLTSTKTWGKHIHIYIYWANTFWCCTNHLHHCGTFAVEVHRWCNSSLFCTIGRR